MQRRLFCPILAAVVLTTALLGGVDRASAAIRIVISDGAGGAQDLVYYSSNSQTAGFAVAFGDLDLVSELTVSNFPGQNTGGLLTQALTLSDITPAVSLPTFSFTSSVIDGVFDGGMEIATGFYNGTAFESAVRNAALAHFTLPSSSFLTVSSDVMGVTPQGFSATGTVQNNTTVNGVAVNSLAVGVNSPTDALVSAGVANPTLAYTLSSEVVYAGGTPGFPLLRIDSISGVTALTPEPGSMVVWGLGAIGLVIAAAARRRSRASPK